MAYGRRFGRVFAREKMIGCSCGAQAKLGSRKNYPFGRKSDSVTSQFYRCKSCRKITFLNKNAGGKK